MIGAFAWVCVDWDPEDERVPTVGAGLRPGDFTTDGPDGRFASYVRGVDTSTSSRGAGAHTSTGHRGI